MSARMLQRALRSQQKSEPSLPFDPRGEDPHQESEEDGGAPPDGEQVSESRRTEQAISNSFDLLGTTDEADEEDELEESSYADESSMPGKPTASASLQVASRKSKKKKKKKKGKNIATGSPEIEDGDGGKDDKDDVDQLLKRFILSEKGDASSSSIVSTDSRATVSLFASKSSKTPLVVDTKHLRAEDELKRIFGSKVINAVERSNSSAFGGTRRRPGMNRKIGRGNLLRKTVLVTPKDYWPSWDNSISMEQTSMKDGLQEFKYVYSLSYIETQKRYELSGALYDPNTIAMLLAQHPYHLESLVSLSEVYKQLGEYQQSVECLERCIFALECAWHPLFNPFNGRCRLPFAHDTNKVFFSALFKHMQHLGRRGCHRSALEVCKLILSMDGDDPLGALFSIDYFALRAEQYGWLEWFIDSYSNDTALWLLPNFSFSAGVAKFYLEQQQKEKKEIDHSTGEVVSSHSLLRQALMLHPAVLRKVVDKAPIKEDREWGRILKHPHFKRATPGGPSLEHLLNLYVERNYLIWRVPDLQAQLKSAAAAVVDAAETDSGELANWECVRQETFSSESNEYRHLHFSEFSDTAPPLPLEEMPNGAFHGDPNDVAMAIHALRHGGGGGGGGDDDNDDDDNNHNVPGLEERNALLVFLQSLLPWTNYGTDLRGEDVGGGDADAEEDNNDH